MHDTDNTLYFPSNVDFRMNYKCATTSIKRLHDKLVKRDASLLKMTKDAQSMRGQASWRYLLSSELGHAFEYPFRKNSVRFTIKRDPIDRFKSAVTMQQTRIWKNLKTDNYHWHDSVSSVLDWLEMGKGINLHFWSQTRFLGNPKNYDHIYDISETHDAMKHICDLCDSADLHRWVDETHFNMSLNTPKQIIEERIETKELATFGLFEDKEAARNLLNVEKDLSMPMITDTMTAEDCNRIKELYHMDYENGYC